MHTGYLCLPTHTPPLVQRELKMVGTDPIDRAVHGVLPTVVDGDRKAPTREVAQDIGERLAVAETRPVCGRTGRRASTRAAAQGQRRTIEVHRSKATSRNQRGATSRERLRTAGHQAHPVGAHRGDDPAQQRVLSPGICREFCGDLRTDQRSQAAAQLKTRHPQALSLAIDRELFGGLRRVKLMF